jgi:hypothetical protein
MTLSASHATPDTTMLPSTVLPARGVMIEMNGATVSNLFALFVCLPVARHVRETRLAS